MRPATAAVMRSRAATSAAAVVAAPTAAAVGVRQAYRVFHPPRSLPQRSPAERGLRVRSGSIRTTRDGLELATWVVPGAGPHTVVLCHGLGRNRDMLLPHITMLHQAGYHVVAYDLRNHGDSGGDRAVGFMADRFVADLRDVLRTAWTDPEIGGGRMAVLALSLSTWPALHLLADGADGADGAEPSVKAVQAVICDSGPTLRVWDSFWSFYSLRRSTLPPMLQREPGFRLSRLAYQAASLSMLAVRGWPTRIHPARAALLFIAGANDHVIAPAQVRAVAARYPWAELWCAPTATHMGGVRLDRAEYEQRVLRFLARAFSSAAVGPTGPAPVPRPDARLAGHHG